MTNFRRLSSKEARLRKSILLCPPPKRSRPKKPGWDPIAIWVSILKLRFFYSVFFLTPLRHGPERRTSRPLPFLWDGTERRTSSLLAALSARNLSIPFSLRVRAQRPSALLVVPFEPWQQRHCSMWGPNPCGGRPHALTMDGARFGGEVHSAATVRSNSEVL